MSVSEATELPKILLENREVGIFLPPVTFSFLYLVETDEFFLFYSILLAASATFIYLFVRLDADFRTQNLLETNEIIPGICVFLFIIPWTVAHVLGVYFLYERHEVVAGSLETVGIVSVGLLLVNIFFISAYTLNLLFEVEEGK